MGVRDKGEVRHGTANRDARAAFVRLVRIALPLRDIIARLWRSRMPLPPAPAVNVQAITEQLENAELAVTLGRHHVEWARKLISELEGKGANTADAVKLLTNFEQILETHIANRDQLKFQVELRTTCAPAVAVSCRCSGLRGHAAVRRIVALTRELYRNDIAPKSWPSCGHMLFCVLSVTVSPYRTSAKMIHSLTPARGEAARE
jgi:hypothetical protein